MIREAKVSDLKELAVLGSAFFIESNLPGSIDSQVFSENWEKLIESGVGKIFCLCDSNAVVGALGAIFSKDLNDGAMVASEAFWFVEKRNRGQGMKLLFHFLDRAKTEGCARVGMAHLFNERDGQLSKIYSKLGFAPTEVHYIKNIN